MDGFSTSLSSVLTLAPADEDLGRGHKISSTTHFIGNTPFLVVFDTGADGLERTVLINPEVSEIGNKQFLGGVVTNSYPDFPVLSPGSIARVALDRVVYFQQLAEPKPENGG